MACRKLEQEKKYYENSYAKFKSEIGEYIKEHKSKHKSRDYVYETTNNHIRKA